MEKRGVYERQFDGDAGVPRDDRSWPSTVSRPATSLRQKPRGLPCSVRLVLLVPCQPGDDISHDQTQWEDDEHSLLWARQFDGCEGTFVDPASVGQKHVDGVCATIGSDKLRSWLGRAADDELGTGRDRRSGDYKLIEQ